MKTIIVLIRQRGYELKNEMSGSRNLAMLFLTTCIVYHNI